MTSALSHPRFPGHFTGWHRTAAAYSPGMQAEKIGIAKEQSSALPKISASEKCAARVTLPKWKKSIPLKKYTFQVAWDNGPPSINISKIVRECEQKSAKTRDCCFNTVQVFLR